MNGPAKAKTAPPTNFVLGRTSFAAISAVEGLKLHSGSEKRLETTERLPQAQRRAETIRAFAGARKHG